MLVKYAHQQGLDPPFEFPHFMQIRGMREEIVNFKGEVVREVKVPKLKKIYYCPECGEYTVQDFNF